MTRSNLIARSLNDLGAAAWFGGLLMGAAAVNRAPADIDNPTDRGALVNGVWRRWWPLNTVAIGAHVVGGALLTFGNRERVVAQRGVITLSAAKTVVMVAAIAKSAYMGWLGKRISDAGAVPLDDGTTPNDDTPPEVASALKQQRILQWTLPALTGLLIILNAAQGEQQRPSHVARGVLGRLNPAA
jgi:hypothetical protein